MKQFYRHIILCLLLLLILPLASLAEEAIWAEDPGKGHTTCLLEAERDTIVLHTFVLNDEEWLFLPTFADPHTLTLQFDEFVLSQDAVLVSPADEQKTLSIPTDGMLKFDSTAYVSEEADGVAYLLLKTKNGSPLMTLNIMQSQNLRSLFLFSDDPEREGRLWLGNCQYHERFTSGALLSVTPDGAIDHREKIAKIRGRGNATWQIDELKKPYQIKLQTKADLLNLGESHSKAKTFILLSEHLDQTLMNNWLALSLSREVDVAVPACEPVDLYYDGDYRGFYLLCEKVEVGRSRVDIRNYDKIIEKINRKAGILDLDDLPSKSAVNSYGLSYTYTDGLLDTGNPGDGGYLLMPDRTDTMSDSCWFTLPTGQAVSLKNPEYASEDMMRFISEKLCHVYETILNGGTNPDGITLDEEIDIPAFARAAVIEEIFLNLDGFRYSWYYVLDADATRFSIGPLWDFDRSLINNYQKGILPDSFRRYSHDETLEYLMHVPAFRSAFVEAAKEIIPKAKNIWFGNGQGKHLQSFTQMADRITASERMNRRLYHPDLFVADHYSGFWKKKVQNSADFLATHLDWMNDYCRSDFSTVGLTLFSPYCMTDQVVWMESSVPAVAKVREFTFTLLSEATEEEYASYTFTAVIEEGMGMHADRLSVNSVPFPFTRQEDGSLYIHGIARDLSYRPVDYQGDDVGLIYNEDIYRKNYPELSEQYGDDSEGLLSYFMEEGIYEGQKGNAFLDPLEIFTEVPEVVDPLGICWDLYYWDFIDYGYQDWMVKLGSYCYYEVEAAE